MKPMADMSMGMASHMQQAGGLLAEAIALHKGHMDGSEPTSPESQQKLMDLIEGALEVLEDHDTAMDEMFGA